MDACGGCPQLPSSRVYNRRKAIPSRPSVSIVMMNVNYVLVLLVLVAVVALSDQADSDAQYRKDLKQINYYNWLLHRHRTEKQKIEKTNKWVIRRKHQKKMADSPDIFVSSDIKKARLAKLQEILDTPAPHNVTLIALESDFGKLRHFVHPVGNKPVTENAAELMSIISPQNRQARGQHDAAGKQEGLVEFQLSEREYQKFSKFLSNRTIKKKFV
ncbi:Protein CBG02985 [Caenorhabditis briggsae]|uniref:Protein CBG02985 n=1 Tax=Caenorhabditis briggsae TaxID=6238 RepID=A8WT20_CAEBR|nr:Protein CBG02985 [Caenorhabditis briggsae]CAP23631.1 Protein CBG02985 [Caenorhabditis briggsae]